MKKIFKYREILTVVLLSLSTYLLFFGSIFKTSHYFWGSDATFKHVPARVYIYNKIVKSGTFPFWTERMYLGFPIFSDMENAYLHPVNLLSILIFGPHLSYKLLHVMEYLVGSISIYFLLKRKQVGILGFVVTNLVYYFSTFLINHQIHYGIIMSFYLLPSSFLLSDLFIEKRKIKYIILGSLVFVNAVLWGHIQSALIMFMANFVYIMVFSFKVVKIKVVTVQLLLLSLLVTITTLPQILPTYELYKQSSRESSLNFTQGSFTPNMISFTFIPYLFGESSDYFGYSIKNKWFSYTETYIYLGLSTVIFSISSLLFLKKDRLILFSYFLIWIFLIFSFLKYNNFIPDKTPIITMFRYWIRTSVLCSFGVGLLAGLLVDKLKTVSIKNLPLGMFLFSLFCLYIYILNKVSSGDMVSRASEIVNFSYIQELPYYIVLKLIFFTSIVLILIPMFCKRLIPKSTPIMRYFFVVVILFDLLYFSRDVLALRLQDKSEYTIGAVPKSVYNKRAVLSSPNTFGMESLYYGNWSPFGTSQFEQHEYVDFFKELDLGSVRGSLGKVPREDSYQKLIDAGITDIVDKENNISINETSLDILKGNFEGEYLIKDEGRLTMNIKNPGNSLIGTYLKYDKNWRIKVDGKKSPYLKVDMFLYFPLDAGEHQVEIFYYPEQFVTGLICTFICIITMVTFYFVYKKSFDSFLSV